MVKGKKMRKANPSHGNLNKTEEWVATMVLAVHSTQRSATKKREKKRKDTRLNDAESVGKIIDALGVSAGTRNVLVPANMNLNDVAAAVLLYRTAAGLPLSGSNTDTTVPSP